MIIAASIRLSALVLLIATVVACQSEATQPEVPTKPEQIQEGPAETVSQAPATESPADKPDPTSESPSDDPSPEPTAPPPDEPVDPDTIQVSWQNGPHADTYVVNSDGENSKCARCHSPINWIPTMDDMPESCFACKFEIDPPPPLVSEAEWEHIQCKVCHPVDRKGNVEAEFAWLEIPVIEEYAEMESPTELCQKCHTESDAPEHEVVQLGGAHSDFVCTDCHNAHDTITSCGAAGCHDEVLPPNDTIPGHDEEHLVTSCVACHDASGLEVGPSEESGIWITFISTSTDGDIKSIPFTSHNTVLEASCERCHFPNNPWELSSEINLP